MGGTAVIEVRGDDAGGQRQRLTGGTVGAVEQAWRAVGTAGHVTVAATAAAVVGVTAWWVPVTISAVATGAALLGLLAAALVDAVEHRLPNPIVALGAIPVVAALAVGRSSADVTAVLTGAAIVGVPLLATHLISPAGMGFGDVKAGVVIGAAVALVDVQLAALTLVLGLAGAAAWGLARGARSIPLGPGLVGGAVAALALGRLLGLEAW